MPNAHSTPRPTTPQATPCILASSRALRRALIVAGAVAAGAMLTSRDAQAKPSPFSGYHGQRPGRHHLIRPSDLPEPFATRSSANPPTVIDRPESAWPQVPPGFRVDLYASGFAMARQLRLAPCGDVLLSDPAVQAIYIMRGVDEAGRARSVGQLVRTSGRVSGVAFYPPGPSPQWLYVATARNVIRYPYRNGDLTLTKPGETIVPRLPETGHLTRDLCFSADGSTLYIGLGSENNLSSTESDPRERNRATILACKPDGSEMHVHAQGLRNPNGLVLSPVTRRLWATCVERDGLGDNLVPDFVTEIKPGRSYGWPFYYIGNHPDPRMRSLGSVPGSQIAVPEVLLQAHSTPLQLAFYTGKAFGASWHHALFSTLHGSWNRRERTGYAVVRIPMRPDGSARGDYEEFMTGFVTSHGKVWGRPVGITETSDGALLVSDDASNSVWRVSRSAASKGARPTTEAPPRSRRQTLSAASKGARPTSQ